ncbi:MAG: FAD-dependent oxidoreductase, partial [Candidatus Omnitrophica bacterium]|nr:FAD-dependent oxidoreductase [Candidatus Omnitrophota bacterium]
MTVFVNIPTTSKPRIVVIGGGFGGLELAKRLRKIDAQIIVIDRNNYHTFQPLLYQVATAALEPDSIAYPFREIFRKNDNVLFRMAQVLKIVPDEKKIETSIGEIEYDYLILATGTRTNFFNMKDVEKHALRMKTIPQAMELRNLILESFEKGL